MKTDEGISGGASQQAFGPDDIAVRRSSIAAPGVPYRICVRCVMDTSDPDIAFDVHGVCSHCAMYDKIMGEDPFADRALRQRELERVVDKIKRAGRGKDYDCIIGVSGGVDSTYVAWKVKELGLRPLAIHLDNGWDAELAVHNIQKVLQHLQIDLDTHVLDWDEFRDLQLAFLRASTPDSEIPSDHAIIASVFQAAWKHRIPHLVMGHNKATELVLPAAWSQGHFDWVYISAVHKQFGKRPLKTFPHLAPMQYVRYRWWHNNRSVAILNYLDYSKAEAMDVLQNKLGWQYYGGKHYESIYTRFFQGYILPTKFGFDKRRAHLANLVLSGEMTRAEALAELAKDPYPSEAMKREDREYVIKKLEITEGDFEDIMRAPPKRYADYPSIYSSRLYRGARAVYRGARGLLPGR
jgi:N-acetyl sugar amidotransferase